MIKYLEKEKKPKSLKKHKKCGVVNKEATKAIRLSRSLTWNRGERQFYVHNVWKV